MNLRSDPREVVIVPKWYGMQPGDAYAAIADVLHGSGGRTTGEGRFRLDLHAVNHLRRQGIAVRNRRVLSVTIAAANHNRDHLAEVRSRLDRNRALVVAMNAHARAREGLASGVLSRYAEASAR